MGSWGYVELAGVIALELLPDAEPQGELPTSIIFSVVKELLELLDPPDSAGIAIP